MALFIYLNFVRQVPDPAANQLITLNMIIPEFVDSIVGFNFFTFFAALIWSVALRFDFLSKIFNTYNAITLRRAKRYAMGMRKMHKLGVLVSQERLKSYKPGTTEEIDILLMDMWNDKKNPQMKILVGKLELLMCEKEIVEMNNKVHNLKKTRNLTENDIFMISDYQQLIKRYEQESVKFRKMLENAGS